MWRALNKIRAAVFRVNLNLWKYFKPLDPEDNNLISGKRDQKNQNETEGGAPTPRFMNLALTYC